MVAMQIEIDNKQYEKLTVVAHAAGYADVPAFIHALAEESTEDPRGSLREEELKESLDQCDRSMAEFSSDGGQDAEEVFLEIGHKRGFNLSQ